MIDDTRIRDWLNRWEALINQEDYEEARPLFAPNVVAFGSLTGFMKGRAELEARQWRQVWPQIRDFRFEWETAHVLKANASDMATVICLWHSLGKAGEGWYDRRGRVTIVLQEGPDGLVCAHSHFSMEPGIPPLARMA